MQFGQQTVVQAVKALAMGQENRAGVFMQGRADLARVHRQCTRIDVHEDGGVAGSEDGGDVRDPGKGRNDHFPGAMEVAQGGHGDEVGGSAGIDEDTVTDAQPLGPFLFKCANLGGLRENGVARQEGNDGGTIRRGDVVFHQGQGEGHGVLSRGTGLEKIIWDPV